jgi:hypothetical protein
MIKNILILVGVITVLFSCTKNNEFLIEKGRVGPVTKTTKIKDLERVFQKDSIVPILKKADSEEEQESYFKGDDKYLIYEKGGKHLLTIIPMEETDSSTIKSVEIFDNRYKTKKGISLYSPYKDINIAYNLSITNTILSAHIDIDELNATMSIDKNDIGINEFNRDEIKPDQIPDLAKIKHFTIWFN